MSRDSGASSSSNGGGKGGTSRRLRQSARPPPVLSSAYLEREGSKQEIVKRLQTITEALSDDSIEPSSPQYPGLGGLSAALIQPQYLQSKDPSIRLHTVLACMELFYIYAPEPPWDEGEILGIFEQMIRQLANLGNCDVNNPQKRGDFEYYFRILEQLSEVKIGVVLVELVRAEGDGHVGHVSKTKKDDDDNSINSDEDSNKENNHQQEALETLCDLIRTILTSIRVDHPPEVALHAEIAISACIEEFDGVVPIPILDEILVHIGAGPVQYVTNPKAVEAAAKVASARKKGRPLPYGGKDAPPMPPAQIQQTNPSYMVVAKIIRKTEDKISSPIAALLNGLLNGDVEVVEQTSISATDVQTPMPQSAKAMTTPARKTSRGGKQSVALETPASNIISTNSLDNPNTPTVTLTPSTTGSSVYSISYELHRIAPQILTTVIGTVASALTLPELPSRLRATKLLGRLFAAKSSDIATRFVPCFREWVRRSADTERMVRETMVRCLVLFLRNKGNNGTGFGNGGGGSGDYGVLCEEVNEALCTVLTKDPNVDVRLAAIHEICDLAHSCTSSTSFNNSSGSTGGSGGSSSTHPSISILSPSLLLAIGNRVSSKNKPERRDAITGLAQIYFKHYIKEKLLYVEEGGDDCSIELIIEVLHDACGLGQDDSPSSQVSTMSTLSTASMSSSSSKEKKSQQALAQEKFGWIPQKVFECVCFSDSMDPDMRNRIFQIVDDVLLGRREVVKKDKDKKEDKDKDSEKEKDGGKDEEKDAEKVASNQRSELSLTPTSRAVGLAIIMHSLKDKQNAFKWMIALLTQRSQLQRALAVYLDARSKAKECKSGSAEAFTADADAMEKLEIVASLSAPLQPTSNDPSDPTDLPTILKKVHTIKDKHIPRLLYTIANSTHSPSARTRAFEELPKRCAALKSLGPPGNATSVWIKSLARRCAMGSFLNVESMEHCIILAQECFEANECECSSLFLEGIQIGTGVFPALCGMKESFRNLVEFFDVARGGDLSNSTKRDLEKFGIVTKLSDVVAKAASSRPASKGKDKTDETSSIYDNLRSQLLRLCRDGSPDQARNSVHAISSLINPPNAPNTPSTPQSGRSDNGNSNVMQRVRKEKKEFEPLLKALVSPSRLVIPEEEASGKQKARMVSVLTALAAVAEHGPYAFNSTEYGTKAVDFALNIVLLGKSTSESSQDDNDSSSSEEDASPAKKSPSLSGRKAKSDKSAKSDETSTVSVYCQMVCAAVEVVVCSLRSCIVRNRTDALAKVKVDEDCKPKVPSEEHIHNVFRALFQVLESGSGGASLPSNSLTNSHCKSPEDQAGLRKCTAINLLRLCDANLQLEQKYVTPQMWQSLSQVFLDHEFTVRESVMEELSYMLTGSGKFRHTQSFPPSLRFVAYSALCADGDHVSHGAHHTRHNAANANAANVGRKNATLKFSATQCIKSLRKTCQATQAQCRSLGREAERNFENRLKMKLMPEYCVPYAMHLLAWRGESPMAGGTLVGEESVENEKDREKNEENVEEEEVEKEEVAAQKMLKKRLKMIFDPLIQSLGEGADNISFLLRMVEILGKHPPLDVSKSSGDSDDELDFAHGLVKSTGEKEAAARMKIICQFAREVLLSYVKKDVNLTVYPGTIQIPGDLFSRTTYAQSPIHTAASPSNRKSVKTPTRGKKGVAVKRRSSVSSAGNGSRKAQRTSKSSAREGTKSDDDSKSDDETTDEPPSAVKTPSTVGTRRSTRSATKYPAKSEEVDADVGTDDETTVTKTPSKPLAAGRAKRNTRRASKASGKEQDIEHRNETPSKPFSPSSAMSPEGVDHSWGDAGVSPIVRESSPASSIKSPGLGIASQAQGEKRAPVTKAKTQAKKPKSDQGTPKENTPAGTQSIKSFFNANKNSEGAKSKKSEPGTASPKKTSHRGSPAAVAVDTNKDRDPLRSISNKKKAAQKNDSGGEDFEFSEDEFEFSANDGRRGKGSKAKGSSSKKTPKKTPHAKKSKAPVKAKVSAGGKGSKMISVDSPSTTSLSEASSKAPARRSRRKA